MLPDMDLNVIPHRLKELGMTQAQLAERAGVHVRQIRRYERGEQQPVLSVAVKLAEALEISLDELAGVTHDPLDGAWWTARQVEVDARAFVITAQVSFRVRQQIIQLEGKGWRGELRRWPSGALTGWYADDTAQGTMYF